MSQAAGQAVLGGVRDLLPTFRDRADEAERLRVVPEASIKELEEVGFFRLLQPQRFDGLEADPVTFEECDIDTVGRVPWWGDRGEVTLHQILVHMVSETNRHAGHADIVRETIDGAIGRRPQDPNADASYDWPAYVARVEAAARSAG